ncbi:MAG: response regulator [Polyangiales bacterium]
MATVLIIEDYADIREMVAEMLAGEGYDTLEAENGQQALELLAARPDEPFMILLDLAMPGMSGAEFLKALEERGLLDRYPTVVVSAQGRPEDVPQAKAFLVKPPDHAQLMELVSRYAGPPARAAS